MHKIFILPIVVLGLASSCTQEYSCDCTDQDDSGTVVEKNSFKLETKSRDEAKSQCAAEEGQFTTYTRSCKLDNF